jgi:hypothetical protein
VAVASSYTIMTSPDGISWTSRANPANNAWQSVTYGDGRFVAVACGVDATTCNTTAGNRVMTSSELSYFSLTGTTTQTVSGTLTGTSTLPQVFLTGSGDKLFLDHASTSDLTISASAGTVTAPALLTTEGNFSNAGTFTGGTTFFLSGDYTNTATVTAPTTLVLDGAQNQRVLGTWEGEPNLLLGGAGTKILTATPATTTDVTITAGTELSPTHLTVRGTYTANGTSTHWAGGGWTLRESAAENSWRSVTYGNGLFVAVSSPAPATAS